MERVKEVADRLEALVSIGSGVVNNPDYEPRKEDMHFIIDALNDILNDLLTIAPIIEEKRTA